MGKNKLVAMLTVFLALLMFLIIKPGDNPLLVMRVATISATIIFAGTFLYNRVLWRVAPFISMHRMIDIGGNWKGFAIDGEGKKKEFEIKILQYFDEVKVKILFDDSYAESLISSFKREKNGLFLYFMYKSKPNEKITSKEDITYGTMIIRCDPDVLVGNYFTSINEKSTFELYRI